jgi:hypothetical protein
LIKKPKIARNVEEQEKLMQKIANHVEEKDRSLFTLTPTNMGKVLTTTLIHTMNLIIPEMTQNMITGMVNTKDLSY